MRKAAIKADHELWGCRAKLRLAFRPTRSTNHKRFLRAPDGFQLLRHPSSRFPTISPPHRLLSSKTENEGQNRNRVQKKLNEMRSALGGKPGNRLLGFLACSGCNVLKL